MPDFKALAKDYINRSITVVPTKKKAPFLKDYYNLSHEEILAADWSGVDGINILTGPRSGVCVLDIDILKSKEPEKFKDVYQALPKAYCGRIGDRDKAPALLFQYNGEKSRKWPHISVEFFGEKGNVVLPPSIHPNGYAYEWHGIPLNQCEVDDLPVITEELFSTLDALNRKYKKAPMTTDSDGLTLAPGRCKHGSHNYLSQVGVALKLSGERPQAIAMKLDAIDKKINADSDFTYFECPSRKEFISLSRIEAIDHFVGQIFANNKQKGTRPSDQSEYDQYRDFFNSHLDTPTVCAVSGNFLCKERGKWKPVLNDLKSMQSYCKEQNLKPSQMEMHLMRYKQELQPRLLVEIPAWDGHDWIAEIISYIRFKNPVEGPVFTDYLKYWVSRIFARLESPINQNLFLLLRGDQGIGKDRLIYNLFNQFDPYYAPFSVQPNREVDTWHQVASHLILHLQEFDQTSKLGIPFLKELITTNAKDYRLPYDRSPERRQMIGSFISTANVDNLFRDTTGNRRFAVFDLEHIDWNYPKDFGLQILAQGKALYEDRFDLGKESKAYMDAKVLDMTPEDMGETVKEIWQERIEALTVRSGMQKHIFKSHEVVDVTQDIARIVGWKHSGVLSYLKRHKLSDKVGGTVKYAKTAENLRTYRNEMQKHAGNKDSGG